MAESNPYSDTEPQKRRSTRIIQAVPLTVTGVDALGRPFQERTSSLIINCHGCRYQSKHYVLKNMWVTFEVPHNEAGRNPRSVRARVTWIQRPRTVRELFQIGVELEVTGNVWGIAFPPSDWFPFPDEISGREIPGPAENNENESAGAGWLSDEVLSPQPVESVADNLRVLPLPGGADSTVQISRQISRLVSEAKQQVQATARESATHAVAAETRPLIAALQSQMKDAAEKSVSAAFSEHIERIQRETLQRIESDREASVTSMREEWSRELESRIAEARQHIDSQLADVEGARRANFERQIENQLQAAIEKLQGLSGNLGANTDEVQSAIEKLRRNSAEAVEQEMRRWQELIELRSSEVRTRLAHMELAATRVGEQITTATSTAESGWRSHLEADLEAATKRWNEKVDTSLRDAVQRVSEQLTRTGEESARQFQQQLQRRVSVIGEAFSQVTKEAESTLGAMRDSIGGEAAKAASTISQLQQSFEQIDARRNDLSSLVQAASDELARRSETLVEAQSNEMNRRSESAVAGMVERLQPVLEAAGQQTIERLANELEQRLSAQITRATQILTKLALSQDQAEKSLGEHQQKIWQASERGVLDSVARGKELLAQVEKEFSEASRNSSTKWLAELESKATETTHSTFEALYKSADWYERKVQTQMQATLEKGVDQAASGLREKAGELSGMFASELEHYTRSYVDHAHGQMEENARGVGERTSQQLTQAGDAAAAAFSNRADQLVSEKIQALNSGAEAVFEQNVARAEAHTIQVRAKLESDARTIAGEFQRVLSRQAQDILTQSKQELTSHINLGKESLRVESQSLNRQLQTSLQSLGTQALDEYKQRLENASNTWMLTTVSKLNQKSEGLIDQLAGSTEKKLRSICGNIFAEMGEALRQRLVGLSVPAVTSVGTEPSPASVKPFEIKPEERK